MSTATLKPPLKARNPQKQLAEALKQHRADKAKSNKEKYEGAFLAEWQKQHPELPMPERDFKFIVGRKFELDFAWPHARSTRTGEYLLIAVEIQGGTSAPNRGAHSRPRGQKNDADKLNAAQALGWKVLTFTDQHKVSEMVATVAAMMK